DPPEHELLERNRQELSSIDFRIRDGLHVPRALKRSLESSVNFVHGNSTESFESFEIILEDMTTSIRKDQFRTGSPRHDFNSSPCSFFSELSGIRQGESEIGCLTQS